jgi:hypothetical protein
LCRQRRHGFYYYIDLAAPEKPFDLLNTFVDPYDEIDELESVYGGRIVMFVNDASNSLIYTSRGLNPSEKNLAALGISADASEDDVDIVEIDGESCIYALSRLFPLLEEDGDTVARIALIVSVEGLSNLRIPRLALALAWRCCFSSPRAAGCCRPFRYIEIHPPEKSSASCTARTASAAPSSSWDLRACCLWAS